jgi:hypothetical protein
MVGEKVLIVLSAKIALPSATMRIPCFLPHQSTFDYRDDFQLTGFRCFRALSQPQMIITGP